MLRHEESPGDFDFFVLRVPGQSEDLHAVLQGLRDRVHHVGCRDEHHLREVVFHIQVMILEAGILLRIQHFEQSGGRVSAEIHAHLVDFVEQEDRIDRARFFDHLDDLAGQRTDIGAAVTADFRFVANASQSEADEFASGRPCDRHAQRCFSNARRANETENRPFGFLDELANREKFQNAFFDFLQTVMVFVQHAFGQFDVADLARLFLPGHREQPVEVVAGNRGFGGHGRHHFQPLHFLHRLLVGVLRHAGGFDLAPQFLDFRFFVFLAQFALDRFDLLVEVVLFLRPFHLALHAVLNRSVDVKFFDFNIEYVGQALAAFDGIENLDQLLLFFNRQHHMGADRVCEPPDVVDFDGRQGLIGVQVLAELHILFELPAQSSRQRVVAREVLIAERREAQIGFPEAFFLIQLQNARALDAFDENLGVSIGQLERLNDVRNRSNLINLIGFGIINRRVVLRGEEDPLVASKRGFECLY